MEDYPLCRCPENICLLHPTLRTCSMREPPRVVNGEVVQETITGRLVPVRNRLAFKVREPHEAVIPIDPKPFYTDLAEVEQRLLDNYGFIGICHEPEPECLCSKPSAEGTFMVNEQCPVHGVPHRSFGRILLTDKE